MMQLEVKKDWSSNHIFEVSDGFNKASISVESWRVPDYQIEQAQRDVNHGYDVNSALEQVKHALGIWD